MPSEPGRLDGSDVRSWGASALTVGGTTLGLGTIGGAIATILVAWLAPLWPPASDPNVASAINVLAVATVLGLSLAAGFAADLLRLRIVDTRPKLETNQPKPPMETET